ncbi:uncharacterized protein J3D65DRAFT_383700 [Phyllosticta citribraziliensis]|uniref:Uncharacterized protein n=1 Tax=Phyllosticta citribraziliensis TaxID=989973 RepID=A0ABR1LUM4_9PEZI
MCRAGRRLPDGRRAVTWRERWQWNKSTRCRRCFVRLYSHWLGFYRLSAAWSSLSVGGTCTASKTFFQDLSVLLMARRRREVRYPAFHWAAGSSCAGWIGASGCAAVWLSGLVAPFHATADCLVWNIYIHPSVCSLDPYRSLDPRPTSQYLQPH